MISEIIIIVHKPRQWQWQWHFTQSYRFNKATIMTSRRIQTGVFVKTKAQKPDFGKIIGEVEGTKKSWQVELCSGEKVTKTSNQLVIVGDLNDKNVPDSVRQHFGSEEKRASDSNNNNGRNVNGGKHIRRRQQLASTDFTDKRKEENNGNLSDHECANDNNNSMCKFRIFTEV